MPKKNKKIAAGVQFNLRRLNPLADGAIWRNRGLDVAQPEVMKSRILWTAGQTVRKKLEREPVNDSSGKLASAQSGEQKQVSTPVLPDSYPTPEATWLTARVARNLHQCHARLHALAKPWLPRSPPYRPFKTLLAALVVGV